MSLLAGSYEKPSHGKTKALVMHVRIPGQRWYRLVCFGTKRHYHADGSCVHTDELLGRLNDYGRKVTTVEPWGGGKYKPARAR